MRRLAFGAFAVLALGACPGHEHADGPTADEYFYDCESAPSGVTTYATDESFQAIVNKEAAGAVVKDDTRAARLLAPEPGTPLSATVPPTFRFNEPLATLAPTPTPTPTPTPRPRSLWARLRAWANPVGTAHAHCAAVTGSNVLLRLEDADTGQRLYTALASVAAVMPSAPKWTQALAGKAGRTVRLVLVRAELSQGDVIGSVYLPAQSPTFVVGP